MNPPREITLSVPVLGLTVGTRAMLAAGVALLLAGRLADEKRRSVGWTLVAVGVLTTVPLFCLVFGGKGAKPAPDRS